MSALRNSFIPKRSPLVISRTLTRLSLDSLLNLCLLWCTLEITAPQLLQDQLDELKISRDDYIADYIAEIREYKTTRTTTKKKIIDKLLVDIYPRGLNLLQYAQIDSQLIVEKSTHFIYWQTSLLIDSQDKSHVLNLHSPQQFLESLVSNLSKYYMNHIYISHHPHYPLIIIRIQLFDLLHSKSTTPSTSISNQLVSRKPFFLALPQNSPTLIHSPISIDDTTGMIILQCISTAFSSESSQIRIKQSLSEPQLLRNLESLHILSGNSRFKETLGVWMPYADGTVDISPFDDPQNHQTMTSNNLGADDDEDERIRRIARLRFRGTLDDMQSQFVFEGGVKKRKISSENGQDDGEEDDDEDEDTDEKTEGEYSSIAPIQDITFNVTQEFKSIRPSLKIKLHGNDVFGGLFELCSKNVIDPELIPGWLTGEEGMKSGVVEDGVFKVEEDKNDGLLI